MAKAGIRGTFSTAKAPWPMMAMSLPCACGRTRRRRTGGGSWDFTFKHGYYMVNINGYVIPYAPWCWNIYLHDWAILGVNVGKYSIHGAYGYG